VFLSPCNDYRSCVHRVKDLQYCHLTFGGNVVARSECVKNIGVYFDKMQYSLCPSTDP
jgi:hypothetical protein